MLDGVTGVGALDGVTALEEVAVCAGSALRVPVSGSKLLFDAQTGLPDSVKLNAADSRSASGFLYVLLIEIPPLFS